MNTEPREVRHYELRVNRGARAGLVKIYGYSQRIAARRFADKLDREYGAICASVQPIFVFATTPNRIAEEHRLELAACGVAS